MRVFKYSHLCFWRFKSLEWPFEDTAFIFRLKQSTKTPRTTVITYQSTRRHVSEDLNILRLFVISGFRRDVDEICAHLRYYADRVVILYRRFGTTYRSHLKRSRSPRTSWLLKMGPIGFHKTSVQNYHSTLRNIPEERRFHPKTTFSKHDCKL